MRAEGEELEDEDLDSSDVILPPSDLSFVEAGEEFTGDGLIPEPALITAMRRTLRDGRLGADRRAGADRTVIARRRAEGLDASAARAAPIRRARRRRRRRRRRPRRALSTRCARPRPALLGCAYLATWSAPRTPRSRRRPRPSRAGARRAGRQQRRAAGPRSATASIAAHRSLSVSTAGCSPRASSAAPPAPARARRPRRRASRAARDRRSRDGREAHGERGRHQPLLGAVVQVALQAPALGVAGLDDPHRARRRAPRAPGRWRSPGPRGRRSRPRGTRSGGNGASSLEMTTAPDSVPPKLTGAPRPP